MFFLKKNLSYPTGVQNGWGSRPLLDNVRKEAAFFMITSLSVASVSTSDLKVAEKLSGLWAGDVALVYPGVVEFIHSIEYEPGPITVWTNTISRPEYK